MSQLQVILGSIIPDSVNLVFRQTACILEVSIDGGTHWTQIADFSQCAVGISSVTATTLAAGTDATATFTDGVLALGIPRGSDAAPQMRVSP